MKPAPKELAANIRYRRALIERASDDLDFQQECRIRAKRDIIWYLDTFAWTYSPRLFPNQPKRPFILWPYQEDAIKKICAAIGKHDIPIKKSRDAGASWLCLAGFEHRWHFFDGQSFLLVSRVESLVDKKNEPDCLFWKIDFLHANLPGWLQPNAERNSLSLYNLENGSSLNGASTTADAGRGGRKAQPLTAKVLTPDGWVTMGDLSVGQRVIGRDGRPTEVTGVFPLGDREVFRVIFNDGTSTECCDEHLWAVTDYKERKNARRTGLNGRPLRYSVMSLAEIAKTFRMAREFEGHPNWKQWEYQIPLSQPVRFKRRCKLPLDPYLLGCLLGDGSFRSGMARYSTADCEMVAALGENLPDGCRFERSNQYDYRICGGGSGRSNNLWDAIKRLGLVGKKSEDKFIPDSYKFSNCKSRLAMLQGLLDTDGWVSLRGNRRQSSRVKFCSASQRLADDVRFLVESLGGVATMREFTPGYQHKGEKRTGQTAYELCITMPAGINPFRLSRKAASYVERSVYAPRRSIVGIEPSGVKPVQCIQVANEDGLYLTDHCIVTHNTAILLDEFAAVPDGYAMLSATRDATSTRIMNSTPKGSAGAYADQLARAEKIDPDRVITMHWSQHPEKNSGLYKVAKNVIEVIDTEWHEKNPNYKFVTSGPFFWEGELRSPWYDGECDRAASPQEIAQELDMKMAESAYQYFDSSVLARLREKYSQQPYKRGEVVWDGDWKSARWDESENGRMLLWFSPDAAGKVPYHDIVVGNDIATGKGGDMSSNSVASIIRSSTGEKIGEFAVNTLSPHEFCEYVLAICTWCNNAFLIWEDTGPGGEFTRRLREGSYGNIYRRDADETSVSRKKSKKLGWSSTPATKRALLADYKTALMDGRFVNRSDDALMECGQYEVLPNGTIEHSKSLAAIDPNARGKNHGDRVIADALAWRGAQDLGQSVAAAPPNIIPINSAAHRRTQRIAAQQDDY